MKHWRTSDLEYDYWQQESRKIQHEKIVWRRRGIIFSVVTICLVLVIGTICYAQPSRDGMKRNDISSQFSFRGMISKQLDTQHRRDAGSILIEIKNEYTKRPDAPVMFPYPFLKDGAHLMEPYRESTVYTEGLSAECGVSWRLERYVDASGMGLVSDGYSSNVREFVVESKGPGKYRFQLMQQCTGKRNEFVVYVRYVRRELSTLTDRDREEFLDALYVVGTVSTEEGKKLYGERYKSQAYLSVIHLDGQDNGYCDQFHNGPGFLASHMYLQAYLEQSMQLVNPRTCLHYWEFGETFTSDAFASHMSNQLDGGSYTEIMTEKWFGQNDPLTGRIVNGRWKDYKVPLMNDEFFATEGIDKNENFYPENDAEYRAMNTYMHTTSPYGYLRSAWNYNPTPSLARYNNLERFSGTETLIKYIPSVCGLQCNDLSDIILNSVGLSVANITNDFGYSGLHSGAHWTVGGGGGDESIANDRLLIEKFGFTDTMIIDAINVARVRHLNHSYNSYTPSIFNCTNKAFDYATGVQLFTTPPGRPGGLQCSFQSSYYESVEGVDILLETIFNDVGSDTIDVVKAYSFEQKKELLKILGNRFTYAGDVSISSSVTDPIFWVLHGSLDRILQLLHFEGAMSSDDFDHVDTCAGHNAESTKTWLSGYYLQDGTDAGKLTLRELQKLLNPLTLEFEEMHSYVYDSSEWSYCPGVVESLRYAVLMNKKLNSN